MCARRTKTAEEEEAEPKARSFHWKETFFTALHNSRHASVRVLAHSLLDC